MKNNPRILVAEDDLTTRVFLTGILEKWGYEVLVVNDGEAALEILRQPGSPELAILDWMMPKMDGVTVIKQIYSNFPDRSPYIILLTSKDAKGDILFGLESGASDYIKKPFVPEELYARLRVGQRTLELQHSLTHIATHDSLTGIFNRHAILKELEKEIARARRQKNPQNAASIAYFDIDHFKQINDQHGHQVGDEVLQGIVTLITAHLREYDSLGRLGGDEFLVIIPGANKKESEQIFQRLALTVASTAIKTVAGEVLVTISVGVAEVHPESQLDEILDTADVAMYCAKRNGGNQVICSAKDGVSQA